MTAPVADAALIDAHSDDLNALITWALEDLGRFWQQVTPSDSPRAVRDALAELMPGLAEQYGLAAATVGADWYDDMREAAQAPGRFRSIPAALPDQGRLDSLVGWGTQPLFADEPNIAAAQSNVEASFQRLVANMDRDTVRGSLTRDPQARGWSRRTTGKSCDFCVMLAARGAVYSAHTADFSAHDRCHCAAVPVFAGDPRPVKPYAPSQRFRSGEARAANNQRIRDYLRGPGATGTAGAARPGPALRDFDATRTVAQLRETLAALERSLTKFDSPGTRMRVQELRRKIAARS